MRGALNVKRALAFVGDLMPQERAKTRATAEARSKKAISTSHCRKNFAATDSLAGKSPARGTRQYTSSVGLAARSRAFVTK